jgi:Holliday junction resolvasome RuvABC ATP-dependent DNA helicase subunit
MTSLHQRYLDILATSKHPMGLKTIALTLDIDPHTIEHDIEPLLLQRSLITKTSRGRTLAT